MDVICSLKSRPPSLTSKDIFDNLMSVRNLQQNIKRPMISATIGSQTVKLLYDTGSCITCMSTTALQKIRALGNNPPKKTESIRTFTSASGGKLSLAGVYEITLTIEGRQIRYPFHVLSSLHENFIVGIDFIEKTGIQVCIPHRKFHWEQTCPLEHGVVISACEETCIPAGATKLCAIKIPDVEEHSDFITEIHMNNRPWLQGAPTWVQRNGNGKALIEITNASPVERVIKRGETVGTAERLDPANVMEIEEEEDLRSDNTRRRLSTQKMMDMKKFIKDNAKINGEEAQRKKYLELFYDFPQVFSRDKNDLGHCKLIQHQIHLKSKEPVFIKQFKIPEGHQDTVKKQVTEWLKLGIIQSSRSQYNSPIFVVAKKDGSHRLVQDFRALNQQTYIDKYSMRDVTECIHEIGRSGSTIFSTIDLTSGFWQMALEPKSRHLTAFTVYGMGQYEFTTSPMGLLGCPASFQRLMETVTKGIPNVIVYIDDILVHSDTHEQHRQILKSLFKRLVNHNLKIRLEKCHFGKTEVEYLGFKLTPNGVLPGTDKLAVVRDTKPPTTVHQVRQFLGLCNFFRQHIKQFALKSHPLTVLTRKDCSWKNGPLPSEALKAFKELQTCLTSEPLVAFPRKDCQYALITDAATGDDIHPGGMGAILTQVDKDNKFYVIAYASKKLEKHEKNYTPFLLEMHAAVWGMEHFSHHLKGKRFLLFTDHKPLEKLGKVHTKTLYRIQEAMLHYDFEIHYKKGEEMPADYLSRNILAITDDLSNIQQEQENDPQLSVIIKFLRQNTLPTTKEEKSLVTKYAHRCYLEDDLLWIRCFNQNLGHRSLICVPKTLRSILCHRYHASMYAGHGGTAKTKERLLTRYFWPNMDKDIETEVKSCHQCQVRAKDDSNKAPLQPLPLLTEPNQRIHADLFGPLKTSENGKRFILVITDAFTKYVELIAIDNKEAQNVAEHIFNTWICRFGIPCELVTDQGKEFTAGVCQRLWDKLNIIHSTTTARHPQCNSQAEVVNKTIAKYLAAFVNETTLDWEPYLPPLMFSYNTSFHRSIKTSPFFLTYGTMPTTPQDFGLDYKHDMATDIMSRLQLARNLAQQNMKEQMDIMKNYYDNNIKTYKFHPNQQVLLDEHYFLNRNPKLSPKYTGPHIILQLKGSTNAELLLNNGKKTIVHLNRLKPYVDHDVPRDQFSKQEREIVYNYDNTTDDTQETEQGEQDNLNNSPTQEQHSPKLEQQIASQKRHLTRRTTQQQGLVYNKETNLFEPISSSETIEALRRKRKKILHRTIQEQPEYVIIEDIIYQVPKIQNIIPDHKPLAKIEKDDSEDEKEELPPLPTPIKPNRTVIFKPEVENIRYPAEQDNLILMPDKKLSESPIQHFARGMAQALFPSPPIRAKGSYDLDSIPEMRRMQTSRRTPRVPPPYVIPKRLPPTTKETGQPSESSDNEPTRIYEKTEIAADGQSPTTHLLPEIQHLTLEPSSSTKTTKTSSSPKNESSETVRDSETIDSETDDDNASRPSTRTNVVPFSIVTRSKGPPDSQGKP